MKTKNLFQIHHLKIQEVHYNALLYGGKTSEVRYNDRDYQKGDLLTFVVIYPNSKIMEIGDTCNHIENFVSAEKWKITHVLHYPEGLKDGYVVLSLKKIP